MMLAFLDFFFIQLLKTLDFFMKLLRMSVQVYSFDYADRSIETLLILNARVCADFPWLPNYRLCRLYFRF